MADRSLKIKRRKLRQPTQSMRERAERESGKNKRSRVRRFLVLLGKGTSRLPIWKLFKIIGRLPIWKPFKKPFRLIGLIIVPPYLRNSWRELRMVEWPNGKQTRALTAAVILFSVVFGIIVAAFDYGLDKLFKEVIIK